MKKFKKAGKYLLFIDHLGNSYQKICDADTYYNLKEKYQKYSEGLEKGNTEKTLKAKLKPLVSFFEEAKIEQEKQRILEEAAKKKITKKITKESKKKVAVVPITTAVNKLINAVNSGEKLSVRDKTRLRKLLKDNEALANVSSTGRSGEY